MLGFSGELLVYRTITGLTGGGTACLSLSLTLFYIFGPSFIIYKVGAMIVWIKSTGIPR